jgi:hypothetical protein
MVDIQANFTIETRCPMPDSCLEWGEVGVKG